MITGFLTTCPKCGDTFHHLFKELIDTMKLWQLPIYEQVKCGVCGTKFIAVIDIQVTKIYETKGG